MGGGDTGEELGGGEHFCFVPFVSCRKIMSQSSSMNKKDRPVKGMNSINLTEMGLSLVKSTKSNTSLSLRPFTTTTFSFTLESFEEPRAESRVRRTRSWPWRRVINSNLKGSRVSKLQDSVSKNGFVGRRCTYLRLRWDRPLSTY